MSPTLLRISSDETLPEAADVVVIGGGIIGATAAFFLAERGNSVAVVEKGFVGAEQSSRNWGWCRQQNRDERELPLAAISLRLWDELTAKIGKDLGFRRCGLIYTTDDPKQLAEWEAWREIAGKFNVNTRMLNAAEAEAKMPSSGRTWLGGVHSLDDGKGEPALAAPMIADGARSLGATIHEQCAARGLEMSNGAVSGVITEKGTIRTQAVLCAGGAWASAFCRHVGVNFPQASIRQTAFRTKPAPNIGDALYTSQVALTRRLDGSYTVAISGKGTLDLTPQGLRYARQFMPMFIKRLKSVEVGLGSTFFEGPDALNRWKDDGQSPFERMRVLDPPPSRSGLAQTIRRAHELFPAIRNVDVMESWGGFVDFTPDSVPAVSPAANLGGFYVAAGCSGHGFGLGPGLGLLAANLVANDTPCVDAVPFRLSRFDDGSKMKVGGI